MSELKELTAKQKIFCEEYIIDWNATRAAIAAGYSENTAAAIGYENLRKPYIQTYIEEIQKDLEKQARLSALRNLLELKKLAYANISNLKKDWNNVKDWNDLTEDEKACIQEVTTTQKLDSDGNITTTVKVKLHDKIKPIEIINRMLGYNEPEQMNIGTYEIDWRD